MTFLRKLALSLSGFLLFVSLSIFGLAYMLNNTLLNPDFITAELNRLDVSSLAGEFVSLQSPEGRAAEELEAALLNTLAKLEPVLKEGVSAATYPIYDYLLGESQELHLAPLLSDTVLTHDFVASLINELDIASLASIFLAGQLSAEIPLEMEFLAEKLDDVIAAIEPTIKEELIAASDQIVAYLLGQSQSLKVAISLEPLKASLRDELWRVYPDLAPAEFGWLPQAAQEAYFNQLYQEFAAAIPSTFELDESLIGTELPTQIAQALADAEETLAEVRQYVSYFQLLYKLLIGLMILLALGIILLSRQVNDITRRLGIPLLIYGASEYIGIFIARYLARGQIQVPEIPPGLQAALYQFAADMLAPLETFSLGLLIGGAVLLTVSFVYKARQPSA